jgi:predicted DNA-binding transcriptional regulator AlpA
MGIQAERGNIPTQGAAVFVNDQEAAALLRISKSHFRRLVGKGELPQGRRLGRRRIWLVAELLGAAE